jgi:5-methylcytosine-specific restriction endonuclease McrA
MPRRRAPLQARKPKTQGAQPKRTTTPKPRTPLLPCGKGYATEAAARRSKRGQAQGAEFELCLLRECGRWHVRLPESPHAGLAGRRDTGPDDVTREAVYKRDGHRCACCGQSVRGRPHSVGHRKRRSQLGGNGKSNLLTFLGLGTNPLDPDDHHARIDSRRMPEDEARGYSLRSWQDPLAEGVLVVSEHGSGQTVWLTDDGGYSFAPPEEAAA